MAAFFVYTDYLSYYFSYAYKQRGPPERPGQVVQVMGDSVILKTYALSYGCDLWATATENGICGIR